MHRGVATFTLDYGKCPPWLFERMVKLSREMIRVLIEEYGPDKFIRRIADPVWFQALGTVLAFDWNASGLTTVLTGALKEALRFHEQEWGVFICGGKGKTSRNTPDEIARWGEQLALPQTSVSQLVYNSRMSAKVDSALVQDNYQLYHHAFFFSKTGAWAVVQQGMNTVNKTARRYHWYDTIVTKQSNKTKNFIEEPHTGIASQEKVRSVLDLTSSKSTKNREVSTQLVQSGFKQILKDLTILRRHSSSLSQMLNFDVNTENHTVLHLENTEFHHHPVEFEQLVHSPYISKILEKVSTDKPKSYEELLATPKVGGRTMRALALISEVIYGAKPSYEDPARYSFALGGKDATPYPVDTTTYDQSITILKQVVGKTHLPTQEKDKMLNQLERKIDS